MTRHKPKVIRRTHKSHVCTMQHLHRAVFTADELQWLWQSGR